MDMLTSFFPPAFPALALSHFVALLSPGPDFFTDGLRHPLSPARRVGLCVGIAAGNGLYIVLAIIGWGYCVRRRRCLPSSSCWAPHICCGLAACC